MPPKGRHLDELQSFLFGIYDDEVQQNTGFRSV